MVQTGFAFPFAFVGQLLLNYLNGKITQNTRQLSCAEVNEQTAEERGVWEVIGTGQRASLINA